MDFKERREAMIKTQLIARGIRDWRVLKAMETIPRHFFVDKEREMQAYSDMALPTSDGQTISQPYMVAVMTELLELKGEEKVLEIGTGSGYQTAILSGLCREVYSIERFEFLAHTAAERLKILGYTNVFIRTGDGTLGWPEEVPFERVIITAAAPEVPVTLIEQLKNQGVLIAPIGSRNSQQLVKLIKMDEGIRTSLHTSCVFVPLIGKYGWQDSV